MTTLEIVAFFELNMEQGDEMYHPSSWWSPEMVMLQDEPSLPLELRLYCDWAPFKERTFGKWFCFAPHHIFKRPNEDEYLVAQQKDKWLLFSNKDNLWEVREGATSIKYNSFAELILL